MLEARVPLPNDKYVYRKLVAHFQFEILADALGVLAMRQAE